jgi:hypothetical protein
MACFSSVVLSQHSCDRDCYRRGCDHSSHISITWKQPKYIKCVALLIMNVTNGNLSRYILEYLHFFCWLGGIPRPTPKLENHPLLSVHGSLFNIFAANLYCWRPFLDPQPEDAPCCGDRDFTYRGKIRIHKKLRCRMEISKERLQAEDQKERYRISKNRFLCQVQILNYKINLLQTEKLKV